MNRFRVSDPLEGVVALQRVIVSSTSQNRATLMMIGEIWIQVSECSWPLALGTCNFDEAHRLSRDESGSITCVFGSHRRLKGLTLSFCLREHLIKATRNSVTSYSVPRFTALIKISTKPRMWSADPNSKPKDCAVDIDVNFLSTACLFGAWKWKQRAVHDFGNQNHPPKIKTPPPPPPPPPPSRCTISFV